MSDTIYREDAIKAVKSSIADGWGRISPVDACQNIRCLPSADTPQGEWIDRKSGWACTNCNKWNDTQSDYCPNCGAKMKADTPQTEQSEADKRELSYWEDRAKETYLSEQTDCAWK